MISFIRKLTLLVLCFAVVTISVNAQDARFGIIEKTGDVLPDDVMLINEDSAEVKFGDLVKKPTLLSFVYYKCPGLCSPVMDGIAEIIGKSDLQLGKDYQIITISINYKEPISLARSKKASYMKILHSPDARQYWQFYVADSAAVKKLTDAAGWQFKRTGNDFVHAAGTILITPHRKISQYFYGTYILPMHFHLAVNDARGELTDASRINEQKYCYNFTPPTNKAYSLIVNSAGIGILVLAAFLFIWLSLTPKPKQFSKDT